MFGPMKKVQCKIDYRRIQNTFFFWRN
jgi:hypothetical protein